MLVREKRKKCKLLKSWQSLPALFYYKKNYSIETFLLIVDLI